MSAVHDFQKFGPKFGQDFLFQEIDGDARLISKYSFDNPLQNQLKSILKLHREGRFFEAAIKFAHLKYALRKANFDPNQPRGLNGRWAYGAEGTSDKVSTNRNPSVAYCKIVKELCIVEAMDTLPTLDDGMTFFRALNTCMDRHGCLGVA